MFRYRVRRAVIVTGLALCGGAGALVARRAGSDPAGDRARLAARELAVRDSDIVFYERRVAADPVGAADRATLAGLYMQRAQQAGDYAGFVRAEQLARASVALRRGRNPRGLLILASSLLGQHRFAEARVWAESLVAAHPGPPSHRALLGEIQLELGDYDAARQTFTSLVAESHNLAVAPRLARWLEIQGRSQQAHAVLVRARAAAQARTDLPPSQQAWFLFRLADIALRNGRLAEAATVLDEALGAHARDARLLSARVRLAVQRADWTDAERWGDEALRAGADIATLALIGDAHAARGDCRAARLAWQQAEAAHAANPEPYARQWTLYRLEHGVALDSTRAVLEREIAGRQDVLGWDLLAWARYLTGDVSGAREALREAMRMGTQDAALLSRASAVLQAAGDSDAALRAGYAARRLNPSLESLRSVQRACSFLAGAAR